MKIFVIGDLHLPGGCDKPMDVFGAQWDGHFEKISQDWRARVKEEDAVLIPGDISWAMTLDAALPDLYAVAALPGKKVLLRGNHDYWWSSITRLRAALPDGMYAIQNDALRLCGAVICGSRGWIAPGAQQDDTEDRKIYNRELMRLEMSLKAARAMADGAPVIAMTHYPPVGESGQPTPVSKLLSDYGAACAVYGHLHGPALRSAFCGTLNGVKYRLASSDGLNFSLMELTSEDVEHTPILSAE